MKRIAHKVLHNYLKNRTFKDFFDLNLTPVEEEVAKVALHSKYSITMLDSLLWSFIGLPAIIYLDTTIIGIVLTPIAMVAGSAWFMISLSAMKAKFANFGSTLTRHILEGFFISLFLLLFMAVYALNADALAFTHHLSSGQLHWVKIISGLLAAILIFRIIYLIMIGSIKYDMNDAMLTGQNEAAQEFFEKSLDFSYQVTGLIRHEKDIHVTNYFISDAFSRIFNTAKAIITERQKDNWKDKVAVAQGLNNKALTVLQNPEMDQDKVYKIFGELLEGFIGLLNPHNHAARKIGYVEIERNCLKSGAKDSYRTKALRYATIFTLIHDIITDEGEDIFL